jgi:hypothetical protein
LRRYHCIGDIAFESEIDGHTLDRLRAGISDSDHQRISETATNGSLLIVAGHTVQRCGGVVAGKYEIATAC